MIKRMSIGNDKMEHEADSAMAELERWPPCHLHAALGNIESMQEEKVAFTEPEQVLGRQVTERAVPACLLPSSCVPHRPSVLTNVLDTKPLLYSFVAGGRQPLHQ